MRDPIDELRNISVAGPALSADEVRRRGDRMRRRRTALQAAGAALAVAVIASGGALVGGRLTGTTAPAGPAQPTPVETATPSPGPRQTETPEPEPGLVPLGGWRTTIPDGFPIDLGLPQPGGDVPEWEWADAAGTRLSAVACGQHETLAARPVDSLRVAVTPPDASAWRHLLLFEDSVTAAEAHDALLAAAGSCSEGRPGEAGDPTSPDEMRWSLVQSTRGRAPVVEVEGAVYARGSDVRVPGRVLTRVVQVGNALLVARLDSASSATGRDAEARAFSGDVERLIEEMCVFGQDACNG